MKGLPPALAISVESAYNVQSLSGLVWPEMETVAHCHPRRRVDFAGGRLCAHAALALLGADVPRLGALPGRGPGWPQKVVGSIAHCPNLQVACVGSRSALSALGVDVEVDRAVPAGVLQQIAGPTEINHVNVRRSEFSCHPDMVVFCVKEAFYKAWCGPGNGRLDLNEIEVWPEPDGTANVRLRGQPAARFEVRWRAADGFVLATVGAAASHATTLGWVCGRSTLLPRSGQ